MGSRVEMAIFSMGFAERASGKDLSNPAMTLSPNPLATESAADMRRMAIEDRNMHRLSKDAQLRACSTHGSVYAGIMDNRFKGE